MSFIFLVATLLVLLVVLIPPTRRATASALSAEKVEATKTRVEILAILVGGIFVAVTWGLEWYWERQDNFGTFFIDTRDAGATNPRYVTTELLTNAVIMGAENEADSTRAVCRIRGTVKIVNNSSAPLHIENTRIYAVPFNKKKPYYCKSGMRDERGYCIGGLGVSDVFDHVCRAAMGTNLGNAADEARIPGSMAECKLEPEATIKPVDGNPLTTAISATRPFEIGLSATEPNQGILFVAETDYGRACLSSDSPHRTWWDGLAFWRSCSPMRARFVYEQSACAKPAQALTGLVLTQRINDKIRANQDRQ